MADEMRVRGNQNIQNPVHFLRASMNEKAHPVPPAPLGINA